jgi:hypothetical protein
LDGTPRCARRAFPSIAVRARTLLAGAELSLIHAPPGSQAKLERLDRAPPRSRRCCRSTATPARTMRDRASCGGWQASAARAATDPE